MKCCFKNPNWLAVVSSFFSLALLLCSPGLLQATEEYSFDLEEFEKKSFEWGGYLELKWDHINLNKDGAYNQLNADNNDRSSLDSLTGSLLIGADYTKGIVAIHGLFKAAGRQDNDEWTDLTEMYEAYVSIKPTPLFTAGLGKKSYKWGKGYAWNPVGFINRRKDPNNPEEALEGFTTAEIDLIKSFSSGPLQNAALTVAALPVYGDVNDDFGEEDNMNMAAKLYLLYQDTDIDFVYFTGDSRSTRYGFDFSRNLASHFEIHGEMAYVPNQKKPYLQDDGSVSIRETSALSYLLGLRYLSTHDITSIIEYYHNGAGYSEDALARFFQLIADGENSGSDELLDKARDLSLRGYGRPYLGRNYLYARFTQKEPFDILYFTPALTTIINLDDESYTITPEVMYTGFTNWEMRFRFAYLNGGESTEYGEKQNSSKWEVRVRYFF